MEIKMGRKKKDQAKPKPINLTDLTEDSTPCEICIAMTGRPVRPNKSRRYFEKGYCAVEIDIPGVSGVGGSSCSDVDKAMLKIAYLNYVAGRSSGEQDA